MKALSIRLTIEYHNTTQNINYFTNDIRRNNKTFPNNVRKAQISKICMHNNEEWIKHRFVTCSQICSNVFSYVHMIQRYNTDYCFSRLFAMSFMLRLPLLCPPPEPPLSSFFLSMLAAAPRVGKCLSKPARAPPRPVVPLGGSAPRGWRVLRMKASSSAERSDWSTEGKEPWTDPCGPGGCIWSKQCTNLQLITCVCIERLFHIAQAQTPGYIIIHQVENTN